MNVQPVVLDTCAVLDLAVGLRLPDLAARKLRDAVEAREVWVPAIVALELAQKAWVGKLRFDPPLPVWFRLILRRLDARQLPLTRSVAMAACALPEPFHRDPADRMLVATARRLRGAVLTSDRQILAYSRAGHVHAIAY